jgi:hypothetical protein
MFAVDAGFGSYTVTAGIVEGPGNNTTIITNILLQNCTTSHFAKFNSYHSYYSSFLQAQRSTQYLCLPFNQNYQIGGNPFTSFQKYIFLNATCASLNGCGQNLKVLVGSVMANLDNR